jgi:hypothetical protein
MIFPGGSVFATLRWTPQEGQASFLVNMVEFPTLHLLARTSHAVPVLQVYPAENEISMRNSEQEPTRQEIDRLQGPVLLEFGTEW